VEALHKSFMTE